MKKWIGFVKRQWKTLMITTAMLGTRYFTVFAATGTTSTPSTPNMPSPGCLGGSQSQIMQGAKDTITLMNQFDLGIIQGIIAVVLAIATIVLAVFAARKKNTGLLWTEIGFGFVAITLVINPTLIIRGALFAGSLFGGNSGCGQ